MMYQFYIKKREIMDRNHFYKILDEVLELNPGTVRGESSFLKIIHDSLSMLDLILILDRDFSLQISPKEIIEIGTVDDLFRMVCAVDASGVS